MVSDYNHKNNSDLRLYSTFLEYLKVPSIASDVEKLIDHYEIKFYDFGKLKHKRWRGWKLIVGNNVYESPYNSQKEWQEAMDIINKNDFIRNLQFKQ